MRLLLRPEAAQDLDDAFSWYRSAPGQVRRRLRDEVDWVFGRIIENPRQFPEVHGEFRRALLPRFPYGVFFRTVPEATIVVAVFPLRQAPRRLASRLK